MSDEVQKLIEIIEKLMGPEGCPWDREQTIHSIKGCLLEEAYELVEAIESGNDHHLTEELGDVLYNVMFFCALGEKERRFSGKEVVRKIREKLIERHPWVFGDLKVTNAQDAVNQWDRIKFAKRESLLDGIPKAMPALAKGAKMAGKMKKSGFPIENRAPLSFESEKELGETLWGIVSAAKEKGLDPEHALRGHLHALESDFRNWEKR